jgi:hypothetical protein
MAGTQITPLLEVRTMEDWEKEVAAFVQGDRQKQEERAKKAERELEATEQNRMKAIAFIGGAPLQALTELEGGLQRQGLRASAERAASGTSISIEVAGEGDATGGPRHLRYIIDVIYTASEVIPEVAWMSQGKSISSHRIQRAGSILSIHEINKEDIIRDFMEAFRNCLR